MKCKEIEMGIIELLNKNRFFGELMLRVKMHEQPGIKSMGVTWKYDGPHLYYCPKFVTNLYKMPAVKDNELSPFASVLKHELEHLCRDTIGRMIQLDPKLGSMFKGIMEKGENPTGKESIQLQYYHTLCNMAADYAINEQLSGLPDEIPFTDESGNIRTAPICKVKLLQKQYPKENIKNNMTFEYYYNVLKKVNPTLSDLADGNFEIGETLDDHSTGKGEEQLDESVAKEIAKGWLNAAAKSCQNTSSAGNIPDYINTLIELLNNPKINWRQKLRKFGKSLMSELQEETRSRRNRRYGIMFPGKRYTPKRVIVNIIDTSGSVSDKDIAEIFTENAAIYKEDTEVIVVECDTEVKNHYKLDPKKKIKVTGRGGTCFQPAFDFVQSKEFKKLYGVVDGIVFATDGYNFDTNAVKKPKAKLMWLITQNGQVSYDFGEKVHLKD